MGDTAPFLESQCRGIENYQERDPDESRERKVLHF
jgi:hypothetical protein